PSDADERGTPFYQRPSAFICGSSSVSVFSVSPWCFLSYRLAGPEEHGEADSEANGDHQAADVGWAEATGGAGAAVAAQDRAGGQDRGRRPVDRAAGDEGRRGDPVDAQRREVLDPVHPVDLVDSHQSQRRQHQDSDARAEVAAVDGDAELEEKPQA